MADEEPPANQNELRRKQTMIVKDDPQSDVSDLEDGNEDDDGNQSVHKLSSPQAQESANQSQIEQSNDIDENATHAKKDSLAVPTNRSSNGLLRRRSSASMAQEQLQALMSARDKNPEEEMQREMAALNEDKQLYENLFDKIDYGNNGDLDMTEWMTGLQKANVTLSDHDKRTLFKCMDGEDSEYVSREDFVAFCIQQFRSEELKRLQQELIAQVRGQHGRNPSNLLHGDQDEIDDYDIRAMQREMSQHIVDLASNLNDSMEKEEKFYEEIEKRASTDPDFAKTDNASKWTPEEVAWWLDSIDFDQYARRFHEELIDGSILLNDIDKAVLLHEMKLKPLHVKKILREIDKLRKTNKTELTTPYKDWHQLSRENEQFIEQLKQADLQIKELQTENAQLKLSSINPLAIQNNPLLGGMNMGLGGMSNMNTTGQGLGPDSIDPLNDDFKASIIPQNEKDAYIDSLVYEIKTLHKLKIELAVNTEAEIQSLRQIIRVLSNEYETTHTPMFKKIHPMDSIMGFLGYTAAP